MVKNLSLEEFKQKVFNFENNKKWNYQGKPLIIDFYANWCGPCKRLSPVLDEIQKEYSDKIQIYKVDTEKEVELAQIFAIRSIPSLLFISSHQEPQMIQGALSKDNLEQIIEKVLRVKK